MLRAVSSLLLDAYDKKIDFMKGEMYVSNLPDKENVISKKVVDLLVSNAFKKNGVDIENVKGKLLDEQKQAIKDMLEELTMAVDAFVNKKPSQ